MTLATARDAHSNPASAGQRLLWILDRYRGSDGALNCPILCRLRGPLDVAALRRALTALVWRHESLRTRFAGRGPALRRVVNERAEVGLTVVDLGAGPDGSAAQRLAAATAEELRRRIDPTVDPLRFTVWRLTEAEHVLCLNMHHLVTDAWSNSVLFADLLALLGRELGVDGAPLPDPGWSFSRFATWQNEVLAGENLAEHRTYWCERLAGARPPALPVGPPATARATVSYATDLDPAAVRALRGLVRQLRTTPFAGLLAGYYALLGQLTGQNDLTVASLFANRSRPEVRRTVGFLANMVLLRTSVGPTASFVDLLRATHDTVVESFVHQAMPFHMLPTGTLRSDSPMRADEVVFQVMADPVYSTSVGDLELEVLVPEGVGSRFDLELALVGKGDGYRAVLFTNPARVPEAMARDLLAGYAALLPTVARRPATALARLPRPDAAPDRVEVTRR